MACNSDNGIDLFKRDACFCHPERSAEQRDARSRRIYAERIVCFGRAEMNRFALIPPLRALAGAPVGMTKRATVRGDEGRARGSALKVPMHISPGQRPGSIEAALKRRPEGAQEISLLRLVNKADRDR